MINEQNLPRDMGKIFEAPFGSQILHLMCHQGHMLVLLRLKHNQTQVDTHEFDSANCQIGLFGLAMLFLLLGLRSILEQAIVFFRNVFHRKKK